MSAIALQKALQLVFAQQQEQDNGTSPDHSTSTAAATTQAAPVDGPQGPKLDAAAQEDQTQRDSWACASSPAPLDALPGETSFLRNITAGQQAKKRRGSVQAAAPSAKRLAGGSTVKPATAATPGQQASNKQDQTGTGHKPAVGPSTGARRPSAPKPGPTQGKGQGAKGSGTGGKPAAAPAATDLPTKTAHPNIKIRDDGKFRVFLSSQGLKYLHVGQYADYDEAVRARDLAVLAVHGAERISTIKPTATYSEGDIAAVRVQMAQRPTAKAVMEANGFWPLKAGSSSSTPGALVVAAAAAEQQAALSPIKRYKGLQYHLPTGGSALAGKRGLAAAAAVGVAGVLAAKGLPMKKSRTKPASSRQQRLQQPLLLPVAERAQHAAKTGSEQAGAVVAEAAAAGAGGTQPASPPRMSRRAAAAGVFAAVVAAGGGSKTPPRHQTAAGEAAAADAASAPATVAASVQHAKAASGSCGQAAAAALQPVRSSLQPAGVQAAVKARNKVSAAAAAAARARAKAAAPAAKQAPAAAAAAVAAAAASLMRLHDGVAGSSEHHARAIANPTGTTGIREHRGVFEVFLSTPPFRYLYMGRAASLEAAERMKQVAMLAVYGKQAPGQQQQPQPLVSKDSSSGASDILDSEVQDMAVRLSAKAPAWEAMQRFGTAALVPAHLQPKAKPLLPSATAAAAGAAKPGRGRPPKPRAAQQPLQQAQQVAAAEDVVAAAAQQQQQQSPAVATQEPNKQLAMQQVKPACRDPRRKFQQQQQEGRQAAKECTSTAQQQVQQPRGHVGGEQQQQQQQQPHLEHEVLPDADGTGAPGTPTVCAARACRAAAAAGVHAVAMAVAGEEGDESDSSEADLSGFESDEWGFSQHVLSCRLKAGHKRRQRVQGSGAVAGKALKQQQAASAAAAAAAAGRAPAGVCSRPLSLCERLQAYAATARSKDSTSAGAGSAAAGAAAVAAGTACQQGHTASRAFDAADPDPMAAVDALEAALASLDSSRGHASTAPTVVHGPAGATVGRTAAGAKLLPAGCDSHAAAAGASTAAAGAGAATGGKMRGRPRKSTATAGAATASASACEVKPGRGKQGRPHSSQPAARVLSQLPLQALLQQHNRALLQQQQLLRLQVQNAKAPQQQQQLVFMQMRPETATAQQKQQQQGQAARVQLVQGLQTLVQQQQQQQQPMQLRMLQIPVLVCQPAGAALAGAQQSQLLAAGQASLQQQQLLLLSQQQQQRKQASSATHSTSNPSAEGPVAAATGAAEQGCAADRTCAVASSTAAAAAPEPSMLAAPTDRNTEAFRLAVRQLEKHFARRAPAPVAGSRLQTPDLGAAASPTSSLAAGPAAGGEGAVGAAAPEVLPVEATAAAVDAAAPEVLPGATAAVPAAKRACSSSSDCPQPGSSASDPGPIVVAASPSGGEAGTAVAARSLDAQHPADTADAGAAWHVMGDAQQPGVEPDA